MNREISAGNQPTSSSTDTQNELKRHSAAFTLSDLELLVYPELLFGLVLANIMSPRIWSWRSDPWFSGIEKLSPYRRILRLKQYIVDHYAFNLDLHTWGLTTKSRELARFQHLMAEKDLCRMSPFFGCEGDQHYFESNIRSTFGLDGFSEEVIPYWKTETVEAMDAFRYCREDRRRAGECVSLAALYCAALYIVAGVSLEKMYLLVTPLHCQVFVDIEEGLLTNNRRVVTKRMWFNGSELSRRARRSLENEQVVLVAHVSGFSHLIYGKTIGDDVSGRLQESLSAYLQTPLTAEIFGNFLRQHPHYQRHFQLRWDVQGRECFLLLEIAYAQERMGCYRITDRTRKKLLEGLGRSHWSERRLANRVLLNDVDEFLTGGSLDLNCRQARRGLSGVLSLNESSPVMVALREFCQTTPKLPDVENCIALDSSEISFSVGLSHAELLSQLQSMRSRSLLVEAAYTIYRDLNQIDHEPFVHAAVGRNPVSVCTAIQQFGTGHDGQAPRRLFEYLRDLPSISIYEGAGRLAQPDEVWNFGRGDGVEKALLLANVLRHLYPDEEMTILVEPKSAVLRIAGKEYAFPSEKGLLEQQWGIPYVRCE